MAKSDVIFNTESFKSENADPSTLKINKYLAENGNRGPKWHEVGAAKYRALQDEGSTSWPAPAKLDHAKWISLPSRNEGRMIQCRVLEPRQGSSKGVFMYIHGGGYTLGHADWQDVLFDSIANSTDLTVLSPEYRLAPENPFPAAPNDCYDVAEYLVDIGLQPESGPLIFIGGESAGANLAVHTILKLLETRPGFALAGTCLNYGIFDHSLLPSARTWENPLVTNTDAVRHYFDAYLPNTTDEQRRAPDISPLYHTRLQYPGSRLEGNESINNDQKLPPALFMTGTQDLVLDDMVLMGFKWQVAGGEARLKFVESAPHAFLLFPSTYKIAAQGRDLIVDFVKEMA